VTSKNKLAEEHYIVVEEDRAQRTSLILQNVCYRIIARIELRNGETNIGKHLDCFRRRIERGECYYRPYLGCREFAAYFEPATDGDRPDNSLNIPIGTMLLDTAYIKNSEWYAKHPEDRLEFRQHNLGRSEDVKGYTKRLFFYAEVKDGWLNIPQEKYDELVRLEACDGTS
jgi:CRISPR-associated protein Cas5d